MSDLTKHLYAIKIKLSNGPASDNFSYSDRLIKHDLKNVRNLLMRQKADKHQTISPFSYQPICVDLQSANYSECVGITLPKDCMLLRSKIQLPEVLIAARRPLMNVTYADGRPISQLNPQAMHYNAFRENKDVEEDKWFVYNDYLFITGTNKFLKKVVVNAIFTDPEAIAELDDSCLLPGSEIDFSIDSELILPMYDLVLERAFRYRQEIRDDENNAKDTEKSQPDTIN